MRLAAALVCLAACIGPAHASAQTAAASVCDITTTERVVAVGDVHGAYDTFVAILRAAGLIDSRDRWAGGRAFFVQTGDVLDRGNDSRRALDLLRRLEREAQRAGGRVVPLLGNHELMRMLGDLRYLSAGEVRAFRNADSAELRELVYGNVVAATRDRAAATKTAFDERTFREQFLKDIPLGFIEMQQAFDVKGEYGPWLRARPTVAMVNGIAYLHGGISDKVAPLGCAGINAAVAKELASIPVPAERVPELLSAAEHGPLWYRGLALEPEEAFAPTLATIMEQMRARGFVIGHTPSPGRIVTRFGGRVVQIDGGMLAGEFFPKGTAVALEVRGTEMTAIYLDRREPLGTLATGAPAAPPR